MSKKSPGGAAADPDEAAGNSEAGTIAALAIAAAGEAEIHEAKGRTFIVLPEGRKLHEVSDPHGLPLEPPSYISQSVELLDKDSLNQYVKAHVTPTSAIFADPFSDTFLAAIDWHGASDAGFNAHRATLKLQRSEEWQRWSKIDGVLMSQTDFARFLEENAADVSQPAGADLLEIARDLSAKRNVNWKSVVRLDNGDQQFEYAEATEAQARSARGDVAVPNKFVLRIPVYLNEPTVELGAFLRYRIDGGSLGIGIQLHRPVFVQQAVFKQVGLDIAERTECPVYTGRPGAALGFKPLSA